MGPGPPPLLPADFGKAQQRHLPPWPWRPRTADQLEGEELGSAEGPQDGMGEVAEALHTETESWGAFPGSRQRKCA